VFRWWRERKAAQQASRRRPGFLARLRLRLRRIVVITLLVVILGPPLLVVGYHTLPPPVTLLMLVRLTEGHGLHKQWIPLREVPPHVADSVIALEDNLFCQHNGFDWEAISDAMADNARPGARLRGASTISQQTAKNVFLWPSRNMARKAAEVPFTWMIENFWGKWRIMEVYLNVVEWGPGVYGIEAAAQHHFHKSARNLTRHEAALLAAALPRPLRWNPGHPSPRLENRADRAMLRAVQLGEMVDCVHPDTGRGKAQRTATRKTPRARPAVVTEPVVELRAGPLPDDGAAQPGMGDAVLERPWDGADFDTAGEGPDTGTPVTVPPASPSRTNGEVAPVESPPEDSGG